jgi:hypothetical protein
MPTSIVAILIVAGIACIAAAIIGRGVKLFGSEVRSPASRLRQVLLAAFGASLLALGFYQDRVESHLNDKTKAPASNTNPASSTQEPPHSRVEVTITSLAPYGKKDPGRPIYLEGLVSGLSDYSKYKVVIYALSEYNWYIQPDTRAPYTTIETDGHWRSQTHIGEDYIALVVPTSAPPLPDVTQAQPGLDGEAIASSRR